MTQTKRPGSSRLLQTVSELVGERNGLMLELLRLLWTIEHDLNQLSQRMEQQQEIRGPDRALLGYISRFPEISAKRLAGMLDLHPSTLSNGLKRLAESGMVERLSDPTDGRVVRMRATPKGIAALEHTAGTIDVVLDSVVQKHSEQELKDAREVLQNISAELKAQLEDRARR